jgi:nucleotidyltransferase substrate binding protein (TIGR01987 family)
MSEDYRYKSFERAFKRLKEVLMEPKSALARDAAVKRFEFTFELSWKAIQRFLEGEGTPCNSPKNCFKEAYKFGLVPDSPLWIRMIEDRNLTVHTYNESVAEEIYGRLSSYIPLFEELMESLKGK